MSLPNKKKLVIVLGMHRSGTSAITRCLELFGIGLGDNLQPAAFDNPKGFWEDRECLEINEELLLHLGSAYDRLGLLPERLKNDPLISDLKIRASQLILRKVSESKSAWGFKDPRTCRLLPFWKEVITSAGCDAAYIIALRNPLSVASSLASRNKIPHEKSYFLWLQHMLPAIRETSGAPRLIVDFDVLLDDPRRELQRISSQLQLPQLSADSPEVDSYVEDFLDKKLSHTRFSLADLKLDCRAPADAITVYQLLRSASEEAEDISGEKFRSNIEALYERLEDFSPAFEYANILEAERIELYEAVGNREKKIANLYESIGTRDNQIASLHQGVIGRDGQIAILHQEIAERDNIITITQNTVSARDVLITTLREQATSLDAQAHQLQQQGLATLQEIQRLQKIISEKENQSIALDQLIFEQKTLVNDLTIQLTERDTKNAELQQAIARSQQLVESMLASKSWRLTKPLRAISQVQNHTKLLAQKHVSDTARKIWRHSPIRIETKLKLKDKLFRNLPWVFSRTVAYRDWQALQRYSAPLIQSRSAATTSSKEAKPQSPGGLPVRLIAFYLPQFHPIPENDEWWGKGFTEWTNVTRAKPQFVGHYQPHLPADLGFYDLRVSDVQHKQVELAKQYGLGGFCFYFYWFGGKTLLETPIKQYLENSKLDLPFCLCWANENWSRRWNGLDQDILIGQQHSPEDDIAFIEYISSYLRDPRYIHISGKPLLLVYRPSLLPSPSETAQRWRQWCREAGIGEIYIAYTQSFEVTDPANYGFDAAIEFPPNNSSPPVITDKIETLSENFTGIVYDWKIFIERSRAYTQPNYTLFRSVCPSWDNTARRLNGGAVFHGSSPELYEEWLGNAAAETLKQFQNPDERLVFVNAWNEWAEGAHLEPDQQYGHAWLEATKRALTTFNLDSKKQKIILVTHDAYPHGAQLLALAIASHLSEVMHFEVETICLGDGPLKPQFSAVGKFHDLAGIDQRGPAATQLAIDLTNRGFTSALVNTTVSGRFLETLHEANIHCVSLIHELPGVIRSNGLEKHAEAVAKFANVIVFPAADVRRSFEEFAPLDEDRVLIRPQGLYKKNRLLNQKQETRKALRDKLGLLSTAIIVIGVGYADHRKGIDLFVDTCAKTVEQNTSIHFVWVGHWHPAMQTKVQSALNSNPQLAAHLHFVGLVEDTDAFYAGADLLAVTSREDPFPSVVLEAMESGLPIVAFEKAGGFCDLLSQGIGILAPFADTSAMSEAILSTCSNHSSAIEFGNRGNAILRSDYSFHRYLFDLIEQTRQPIKKVSVVVPNYNYARYIESRLVTIQSQTHPIYELIILDDNSTDNSDAVIQAFIETCSIATTYIKNTANSGSVFAQWKKGVELATGDYVWIAEADDLAEPTFLETTISGFDDLAVVLSYCESKQIDSNGQLMAANYHDYLSDLGVDHWLNAYNSDGKTEIQNFLSVKNTIPNVSAALMRRDPLLRVLTEQFSDISKYRVAGDWKTYLYLLEGMRLAFNPASLNLHRRHETSVTIGSIDASQLQEIGDIQDWAIDRYECPKQTAAHAKKYLQGLFKQFDIPQSFPARLARNPAD